MQALPVVEDLQVVKNTRSCLLDGLKVVVLDTFGFERGEKTLHQRIVVQVPLPTHTEHYPVTLQESPIAPAGILTAAIGVMYEPGLGPATAQRHFQGRLDQRFIPSGSHGIANGPTRIGIHNAREVEPPLLGLDGGDIGHPCAIGRRSGKIVLQQVRSDGIGVLTVGGTRLAPALPCCTQPRQAHEPCDPLAAAADPVVAQERVHPREKRDGGGAGIASTEYYITALKKSNMFRLVLRGTTMDPNGLSPGADVLDNSDELVGTVLQNLPFYAEASNVSGSCFTAASCTRGLRFVPELVTPQAFRLSEERACQLF